MKVFRTAIGVMLLMLSLQVFAGNDARPLTGMDESTIELAYADANSSGQQWLADAQTPGNANAVAAEEEAPAEEEVKPMITNDAVVMGMLMIILALVFYFSHLDTPFWKKFFTFIPALLLCYFLPALLNTFGIVDGEESSLYFVASRYLLPTSLVLLTLSIDIKGMLRLGPKAIGLFLTGTLGIVIGGPIALWLMSSTGMETTVEGQDLWRGLSTVAGSWIGGGANQTAMKEVWDVNDDFFGSMVAVDVIVANIWMAFLLFGAGISDKIDRFTGADNSAIKDLQNKMAEFQKKVSKNPSLTDMMIVVAVGFGVTAIAHFFGDLLSGSIGDYAENWRQSSAVALVEAKGISMKEALLEVGRHWTFKLGFTKQFFWLIVIATTGGLILSFTKARNLEGYGASKFGSLFLYVLVATIGMKMNLAAIGNLPLLFLLGLIWISIHAVLLIGMAWITKSPFFFLAVGSQANVGGAASAPVVAAAFNPALAPVGVLLAVFGYALGTYAAYGCSLLMQAIST